MSSANPVVLLVSNDSALLHSRADLLSSLGLWPLKAQNLSSAVDMLEVLGQTRCDLVVICHSINRSDREQLLAHLITNYPWMKVVDLALSDDRYPQHFLQKLEDVLESGVPIWYQTAETSLIW